MKNNKIKRSIDLEEENYNLLINYIEDSKIKNMNVAINKLIDLFIIEDQDIKTSLINFSKSEIEKLNNDFIDINSYNGLAKEKRKEFYIKLIEYLNYPNGLYFDNMKQIKINNGYVNLNNDWIILNEEVSSKSKYVNVIEVIKNKKVLKHFIYFSKAVVKDIPIEVLKSIKNECEYKLNLDVTDLDFEIFLIQEYKSSIKNYPYNVFIVRN